MKANIGDLIMTRHGNLGIVTDTESCGIYLDVWFCNTGYHRTGLHWSQVGKVYK